jgi:hypothetical protein
MVSRFRCGHRCMVLAALGWIGATAPAAAQAAAQSPTAAAVGRSESRQADSLLNGILIGAGVGAIPGIYWLVVDPNECTGLCTEDYVAIGVGAVIGGLIDRAITRKATVSEAGVSSSSTRHLLIRPFVGRKRSGVQLAVRF